MIRIVSIPMSFPQQEEAIKKWGITKDNLIDVTSILMSGSRPARAIVTFDDEEGDDA